MKGSNVSLTEKVVTDLLRDRYTKAGNGGSGEWAFFAQVRNAAGFDATRTFDALALGLWPSRGHAIHIFEIKVSRSDWQRELSKPEKAEDAAKLAEHFWIVAPKGCVRDGELPATWGLIEVVGDGGDTPWSLRTKKTAPLLHERTRHPDLTRSFVVGLLRSVPGAVPGGKALGPLEEAERRGYEKGAAAARATIDRQREEEDRRKAARRDDAERVLADLQSALEERGVRRLDAGPYGLLRNVDAIADALKGAGQRATVERAVAALRSALDELGKAS